MATDSDAAGYGFNIPTDTNTQVSALPGIIRQNARAASPDSWLGVGGLVTGLVNDIDAGSGIACRMTPYGIQLRGEMRTTALLARDTVVFTLPTACRPRVTTRFHCPSMGPGSAYAALAHQVEIRSTGQVILRQAVDSGTRMSFNGIFAAYLT